MYDSKFCKSAAEAVSERAKLDATGDGAPFLYYDGEDFYLSQSSGVREYGWDCGDIRDFDPGDYSDFYDDNIDESEYNAIIDVWTDWLSEIADEYDENND